VDTLVMAQELSGPVNDLSRTKITWRGKRFD
jgi:hypothetical protein